MVYDPSHPDAERRGYVAMPIIQVMTEMVNMIAPRVLTKRIQLRSTMQSNGS